MKRVRSYSAVTIDASRLLGARIRLARHERGWTLQELADRVGVSHPTIHKVENGDPTVAIGIAFEAAATVGVPLYDADRSRRLLEATRVDDRLALLPKAVRKPVEANDDF